MLEQTFFCIRPYIFEKRRVIKQMIKSAGLTIKNSKVIWLTPSDVRVIYGHEDPSTYFDACNHFMTTGFVEVGVVEGEDVIEKLTDLVSTSHKPGEAEPNTMRAIFGEVDPIKFEGFDYYLNPLHRSRDRTEAEREIAFFSNHLVGRSPVKIISDMLLKLYQDRELECVYDYHIKLVVEIGLELAEEIGADKEVVELACWLHDIASLINGNKHDHHVDSARRAAKLLSYFDYDYKTIKNVLHCIETHRGKYSLQKMTKEAEVVCSADGMANLSCPNLLCYYAYGRNQMSFEEGAKKIRKKIESSFGKISEHAKPKVKKQYMRLLQLF